MFTLRRFRWCPLFVALWPAAAAAQPLPPTTVVLYTIGQGDDIFEKFGHTALCVRQPQRPDDGLCFDYGTGTFDDFTRFAWQFLRGQGSFGLSWEPESLLIRMYEASDRAIWRQVLPLTPEQAESVRRKVFADAQDPGWRYAYRMLDDNCATRVRDIIDAALGGRLRAVTAGRPGSGLTLREQGIPGFAELPLALLLVDLFLGAHADDVADRWQAMFLPTGLRDGVRDALGVRPEVVRERAGRPFDTNLGWGGREWLFLLALILAAPLALTTRLGHGREIALVWAVLPLVLLGSLVWFVAVVCPFPEGRVNEVLLVFLPYDVVLPFLREAGRRYYARVRVALLAAVSLFAAVGVFRQPLWASILVVFAPMAVLAFPPHYGPATSQAAESPPSQALR